MIPIRLARFIARMTKGRPVRMQSRHAIASISFDDFPKSAWETGGRILARHKVRGTYYIAGGFCGGAQRGVPYYSESDLKALAEAGHEIACHGFGHQPVPMLSAASLEADRMRNAQFLAPFLGGRKLESYAYPYGAASLRAKKFYADHFSNIRGVHPGINEGQIDLSQLNTISMEMSRFSSRMLIAALAEAQAKNGWLCFYTHAVCDNPREYDSTPAILEEVLRRLADAKIEILPMREAVAVALGSNPVAVETSAASARLRPGAA